jgi:hypothetical protein
VPRPTCKTSTESEQDSLSYNTPSTFSIIRSKDRKLRWIKSITSHHLHHRITKTLTSLHPHHYTTISSTNNRPRHKSAPQTPRATDQPTSLLLLLSARASSRREIKRLSIDIPLCFQQAHLHIQKARDSLSTNLFTSITFSTRIAAYKKQQAID